MGRGSDGGQGIGWGSNKWRAIELSIEGWGGAVVEGRRRGQGWRAWNGKQ